MMKRTYAFLAVLLFLSCSKVMAYDAINHTLLTKKAITIWNRLHPGQSLSASDIDVIIEGNLEEDKKRHFQRANHWHFFKPHYTMDGLERRMSARRLYVLQGKLRKAKSANDRTQELFYIGALMHHLQDLTVPAHVTPIMHGGWKIDRFDEMEIDTNELVNVPVDATSRFSVIVQLIQRTAEVTFLSFDQPFEATLVEKGDTSTVFLSWDEFYEIDHVNLMGKYGRLGKRPFRRRDAFGQPSISVGRATYLIEAEAYDSFRHELLMRAVESSVILMNMLLAEG